MNSFNCEICQAPHIDTRCGYISSCTHHNNDRCEACGEAFEAVDGQPGWLACSSCWRAVMGGGHFTCPQCGSHYFGRDVGEVNGAIAPLDTIRCHGSSSGPLFFGDSRGMCKWRGVWPVDEQNGNFPVFGENDA